MDKSGLPYSHVRAPGHEHIPIYPGGFIGLRIVQLVLAVVIMGLAAFTVHFLAFDGNVFILACAIMTLIASIYHLVVKFSAPEGYNYWAVLGLDMLLVVLWLCSFALLASETATLFSLYGPGRSRTYYDYYWGYTTTYSRQGDVIYLSILAAAAAFGGVEFALHIVSLVIHSIRLHRHRKAGLHCHPGVPRTIPGETPAPAYAAAAGRIYPSQAHPHQAQQYQQQPQPMFYAAPQQPQQAYYPSQAQAQPQPQPQPQQQQQQQYTAPQQPAQYAPQQQQQTTPTPPAAQQQPSPPYGGAAQLPSS